MKNKNLDEQNRRFQGKGEIWRINKTLIVRDCVCLVAHAIVCGEGDMVKMGSKIKFHLENQRLEKHI